MCESFNDTFFPVEEKEGEKREGKNGRKFLLRRKKEGGKVLSLRKEKRLKGKRKVGERKNEAAMRVTQM